jgi:hypothetical protein
MTEVGPSASNRSYRVQEATMMCSFGIPPLLERSAIRRFFAIGGPHGKDMRKLLPETLNPRN